MASMATELELDCIRGATKPVTIKFDPEKKLVIVFGENGTGKSTIVDAFDMIANGVFGSIEGRSTAKTKHVPSIGKRAKDLKVGLKVGEESWSGSMAGAKIEVAPSDNRPAFEILRRNQLLNFVEAAPGQRYKVVQSFIDVSGVEASEQSVLDAVNQANQENTAAIKCKIDAEEKLNSQWEENGKPGESWTEWAVKTAKLETKTLSTKVELLEGLVGDIGSFRSRKADFDLADTKLKEARAELEAVEIELQQQQDSWSDQTPSLIGALEQTSNLLEAGWQQGNCPVCQLDIKPDELRKRVSQSLDSMKALKTANDKQRSAYRAVDSAANSLASDRTQLVTALVKLLIDAKSSGLQEVNELSLDLETALIGVQAEEVTTANLEVANLAAEKIATVEGILEKQKDDSQRDKNQLHSVRTNYGAYTEADEEIEQTDLLKKKLEIIHKSMRDKRIAFVQDILDSVSNEIDRLYTFIHPDEDVKSGRLELATNKRASLQQFGEFAGTEVEPQGYFSDSHLDTLGFCCWLALAKREDAENKIIVLDDVFSSVDAPHLGRILELIDQECVNFAQFFAMTHNRVWVDRFRQNQAAGKTTHLIQLVRWTNSRGISHHRMPLELDEIETLLQDHAKGQPLNRQGLSSRCGILLEAVLTQLSLQYRCSVPHTTDGAYTLGELKSSCAKLMKKLERIEIDEDGNESAPVSAKPPFDELFKIVFIRNQVGCHFNLSGATLSDAEVEEFGKKTVDFVKAVVCNHCGDVPRADKSNYRQCTCAKTRLTPVNFR